jgi:hypothetical protein
MNSYIEAPIISAQAITPSDTTVLTQIPRGVWVGGSGNLAVLLQGDTVPVTFLGVSGGLSIAPQKIMATNTTATNILAVYT